MRLRQKVAFLLGAYLILSGIAGIVIAGGSLHLRRLPLRHAQQFSAFVKKKYGAELKNVSIQADDGAVLKGWYVQPQKFNGSAVVLLHGITDNREGVAGYGKIFLDRGYAVLLPDARAHGESGGALATYGIKEAGDLHEWVSWLYGDSLRASQCVYGFGESYGAALLLQTLPVESRFCAVAVEDSFSTAREMSYERVSSPLHLGPWFGKTLGQPMIDAAVLYSKMRYGIDLLQPSPLYGLQHSRVPVLLIQGAQDQSIRPKHAEILANAASDHAQLWMVPFAGHTMAWTAAHQEFEARVTAWFEEHQHAPGVANELRSAARH
ncbi:MAG TPA: alpha/beta fold hydrolase [Candidatus Angelobacter sp.]|nr:alpha/beta fold hydrolase [Candidatus Angelobacter sp.]